MFIGFLVSQGTISLIDAAWVASVVLTLIFVLVFRGPCYAVAVRC
ncbi:hypothetical protein [Nocardia jinanensis]|nr:hypothetical protein [Nocardia jinanensis]